jgi:uncharacterized protein
MCPESIPRDRISVEVVYIDPPREFLCAVELAEGAVVADALAASGLAREFPLLDLATAPVGIFSRPATLRTALRAGDRVEVYRALKVDPKEVRRRRAAKKA